MRDDDNDVDNDDDVCVICAHITSGWLTYTHANNVLRQTNTTNHKPHSSLINV